MQPAPGYVLARESPVDVDEEQRPSGLIVKHDSEARSFLDRAVVEKVGVSTMQISSSIVDELTPGVVIFYTSSYSINDFVVISFNHIVAYES